MQKVKKESKGGARCTFCLKGEGDPDKGKGKGGYSQKERCGDEKLGFEKSFRGRGLEKLEHAYGEEKGKGAKGGLFRKGARHIPQGESSSITRLGGWDDKKAKNLNGKILRAQIGNRLII